MELLIAMHKQCPRVRLRDIWKALKKLEARRLVHCLTPKEITGRLYCFTDQGREFAGRELGVFIEPLPQRINWKKYSNVVRGSARKAVLQAMERPWRGKVDKTMAAVRRLLIDTHPLCMSAVIRAKRELERLKLIRRVGASEERGLSLYRLTAAGDSILEQLKNQPEPLPKASSSNALKGDAINLAWQEKLNPKNASAQDAPTSTEKSTTSLSSCATSVTTATAHTPINKFVT